MWQQDACGSARWVATRRGRTRTGAVDSPYHIPTKQKRRSTGQGAKNSLDPQRPEKRWVLRHLRPRAFAPQASVMASSEQDDVATSIPVSCDGVKTHVFMRRYRR